MTAPRVEIDLGKITQNTRSLVCRLAARGISVTGVTKAVGGHPDVAEAILKGGATGLADARIMNIYRMRVGGITNPISMIRAPMVHEVKGVIKCCDMAYNTELATIRKLGFAARNNNTVQGIVLMVEMGDLREGIMPERLDLTAAEVIATSGIALKGIAANFGCLSGLPPSPEDMARFSGLADQVECSCGTVLEIVSGGGSSNLQWALGKKVIGRINNLRLGEAILLGVDPVTGSPIHGLHTNAFSLFAEVIETSVKSQSLLARQNALSYGKLKLVSKEADETHRSVLAVGQQDTDPYGLTFPPGVEFVGATSDHIVVETRKSVLPVGETLKIGMNYRALTRVMNAPDVEIIAHHWQPVNGAQDHPHLKLV